MPKSGCRPMKRCRMGDCPEAAHHVLNTQKREREDNADSARHISGPKRKHHKEKRSEWVATEGSQPGTEDSKFSAEVFVLFADGCTDIILSHRNAAPMQHTDSPHANRSALCAWMNQYWAPKCVNFHADMCFATNACCSGGRRLRSNVINGIP